MNDFLDLMPPPARDLTTEQRSRIRARLPIEHAEQRQRSWLLAGAAAAAVVLVGVGGAVALSRSVGGDDSPRPVQPAVTKGPEPMKFTTTDGTMCLGSPPRTAILVETTTPLRDLVLSGVSLDYAQGATLGGSWVADARTDTGPSGAFQEGTPGIPRSANWQNRRPLPGAVLEAGKTYVVFARVSLVKGGRLEGVRFSYTDAGTPGSSLLNERVEARTKC